MRIISEVIQNSCDTCDCSISFMLQPSFVAIYGRWAFLGSMGSVRSELRMDGSLQKLDSFRITCVYDWRFQSIRFATTPAIATVARLSDPPFILVFYDSNVYVLAFDVILYTIHNGVFQYLSTNEKLLLHARTRLLNFALHSLT